MRRHSSSLICPFFLQDKGPEHNGFLPGIVVRGIAHTIRAFHESLRVRLCMGRSSQIHK